MSWREVVPLLAACVVSLAGCRSTPSIVLTMDCVVVDPASGVPTGFFAAADGPTIPPAAVVPGAEVLLAVLDRPGVTLAHHPGAVSGTTFAVACFPEQPLGFVAGGAGLADEQLAFVPDGEYDDVPVWTNQADGSRSAPARLEFVEGAHRKHYVVVLSAPR